jgi:hypothetical protein
VVVYQESYDKLDIRSRHERQLKRSRGQYWQWILLGTCVYWTLTKIALSGWSMPLWIFIEPLNCVSGLVIVLTTLWLIWRSIRFVGEKRSWLSTIPLLVIASTIILTIAMPTKAEMILRQNRTELEEVVTQAKMYRVTRGQLDELMRVRDLLPQLEGIRGGTIYKSNRADQSFFCIKFNINVVGLVYSGSGELADCSWKWPEFLYARRLNENWFETNNSWSLWFLQPKRAQKYISDAFDDFAGGFATFVP